MKYKVVLEIELEAESPLEAVKEVNNWVKDSSLQYYAQGSDNKIFSVDLSEEEEDAVLQVYEYIPLIS